MTDLADILECTVDFILRAGETSLSFKGKTCVADLIDGINALKRMGEQLGSHNLIYRYAIEGINQELNTDIESAFTMTIFLRHLLHKRLFKILKPCIFLHFVQFITLMPPSAFIG